MKELTIDQLGSILRDVPDGVLALSNGKRPYCIPFGFVSIDGTIYLSMFPSGRKWTCIKKNPQVCFTVFCWNDDRTEWYSVVVDGTIEQISDMETIEAVVKANMVKVGLDPAQYLEKRIAYYKKSMDNPKALKIFRINAEDVKGRKMHTMIGQ